MQLFVGHIVSSLHLLKERIFFSCVSSTLVFKFGLCLFYFPHLLNFFPKLFFPKLVLFFLFLWGEKSFFFVFVFLNLYCSQRELLLFIGGVSSILYRAGFFCFLDSLFSLDFCCICFLFALCLSCLCQYVTKRGRFRYSYLFFLGGVEIVFVRGRYYVFISVSCFICATLIIDLYL